HAVPVLMTIVPYMSIALLYKGWRAGCLRQMLSHSFKTEETEAEAEAEATQVETKKDQ
ncbi:hypothetical protein KIPB_009321, partial [Kipferlia bialata]